LAYVKPPSDVLGSDN
jgi:magnesium-transporting ATPase (P-type)